ncbi:unnamed protein product, partial [Aphanomyces euteiches]
KSPLVSPLRQRRPYWEASYTEAPIVVVREHDLLLTPSAMTPYNFNPTEMLFTPRGHEAKDDHGRLVEDEERAEGRVSKEVVLKYLECIGGWRAISAMLGMTMSMQAFKLASDLWLTKWSNGADHMDPAVFVSSVNVNMTNGFVFVYCVRGTSELFSAMLASLLAAPMRFFDVTPIGRILNRAA